MKTKSIGKVWMGRTGLTMGCLLFLAVAVPAFGDANYVGTPSPISPEPGYLIPGPTQVPGKEYADMPNKNTVPAADPHQVIAWDGLGGVMDSFDYTGTGAPFALPTADVDALANHNDALFSSVVANTSALLISVTGDSALNSVWSESVAGATAVWATKAQIDHHGVTDLDGLELWGPDFTDDSDRFSLLSDPVSAAGKVAVWAYNPIGNVSTPYISDANVAAAIGRPDLSDNIDLDALMTRDNGDDSWGTGDEILFSIRAIDVFDGGEVWYWQFGSPAVFLNHGGHLWNTAFPVMATFGVLSENVDALEAVSYGIPEPGAAILFGLGLLIVARCSKRIGCQS